MDPDGGLTIRKEGTNKAIIPSDKDLKHYLLEVYHNHPTAGYPGWDETLKELKCYYYWPLMSKWVKQYVQGCTTCQESKIQTHWPKTSLYKILVPERGLPFRQVAMDLIIGLPTTRGHNTIVTIVDHGCSRVAIFLPITDTVTGADITQLYIDHVYRWFGLPEKIISNQDPHFTSHFSRELTKKLAIGQNLSTAIHPQTDGLSE